MKKLQLKQINDRIGLSIRRCKSRSQNMTARQLLQPDAFQKLVNLDEGYYIFRTIRNSPAYLEKRKKDIFAMIRQLGLPTWFTSFSAADTKWPDLLRMIGKLVDKKHYSDIEIEEMDWSEKTRLLQSDPVTCSRYFDFRVSKFLNLVLKSPHNPLGEIKDYFYRVEFQQRGSPHIHMMIWIKDAPVYGENANKDIEQYVDKYVSCSSDVMDNTKQWVHLQTHKHSKTCRKKGKAICRFGYPIPPMPRTCVLEPLETTENTDSDEEEYFNLCAERYKKIEEILQQNKRGIANVIYRFLAILKMSQNKYLMVLREV